MNSIKTFWSPELKKERALRKEELSRMVAVREQLKVAQEENQVSVVCVGSGGFMMYYIVKCKLVI